MSTIEQRARKALALTTSKSADGVTAETVLKDRNGPDLDSLEVVEFCMALEDEFHIEIPDEMFEAVKTFGDAVKVVEKFHLLRQWRTA